MKPLAFIVGLLLLTSHALADTNNRYGIEMMLVAYTDETMLSHEHWQTTFAPETPVLTANEEALVVEDNWPNIEPKHAEIDALEVVAPKVSATWWEDAPLPVQLDSAAKRIALRSDMKILWHHAWEEDIQAQENAIAHPFDIQLKQKYSLHLTGTVSFSLSRYLHINTDLTMQHSQLNAETGEVEPLRAAHIQLNRRMRSNELHYVDHPMLGIIVKIVPIKVAPESLPTDAVPTAFPAE